MDKLGRRAYSVFVANANVTMRELASRFVEALNRRDERALVSMSDPEIELRPTVLAGSRRTYRGYEGLREWVRQMSASSIDYTVELREVHALGERRFLAVSQATAGGEYLSPWTMLASISDEGRLQEARAYLSDEPLLRRLGLVTEGDRRAAR